MRIFDYMGDMRYVLSPIDTLPPEVYQAYMHVGVVSRAYPLVNNKIRDWYIHSPTNTLEWYINDSLRSISKIHFSYPTVTEIFVKPDDNNELAWCFYKLSSKDEKNIMLQASLGGVLSFWVLALTYPRSKSDEYLVCRNATRTYELIQNSKNFHSERYHADLIDANARRSIISMPIRIDGNNRFCGIDDEGYYDIFARLIGQILSEIGCLQKLYTTREGLRRMHGDGGGELGNSLFFYDNMHVFLSELKDFPTDAQKDLQRNRHYHTKHFLYAKSDYFPSPEIEETARYVCDDCDPYDHGFVTTTYIIHWHWAKEEWVCVLFDDEDLSSFLHSLKQKYDAYELRAKIPTIYNGLINGATGDYEKGAIIEAGKYTIFKCEYDAALTPKRKSEINDKCEDSVLKLCAELVNFIGYIKLKEERDSDKQNESSSNFIKRYILLDGLRILINSLP